MDTLEILVVFPNSGQTTSARFQIAFLDGLFCSQVKCQYLYVNIVLLHLYKDTNTRPKLVFTVFLLNGVTSAVLVFDLVTPQGGVILGHVIHM